MIDLKAKIRDESSLVVVFILLIVIDVFKLTGFLLRVKHVKQLCMFIS